MADWTDALRASVIKRYKEANPTPENTGDIVKTLADSLGEGFTTNGVIHILLKADCYVKKAPKVAEGGTKTKRVNKTEAINELSQLIIDNGGKADNDILGKLTGKAAVYFTTTFNEMLKED